MPIFPSREKRKIYARRIKSFWEDFSHNRIGIVGICLILLYVFVALFAEFLTPYGPRGSHQVAARYAVPAWTTILPGFQNLPPTTDIPLNWTPTQAYDEVAVNVIDGNIILEYNGTGKDGSFLYTFQTSFDYTYDAARSFEVRVKWTSEFTTCTIKYRLEVTYITPDAKEYLIFGEDYSDSKKIVEIPTKFWNMTNGQWIATSGSIDLRKRMWFQTIYDRIFQEEYDKYLEPMLQAFYDSLMRIQKMLYERTHGTLESFDDFWYGPDGYWNTTGIQRWEEQELPRHEAAAAVFAHEKAYLKAGDQATTFDPARTFFVQKGTHRLILKLYVEPLSENASLKMTLLGKDSRFRIWGSFHGILGTDPFGADVWNQLVYGARISLIVGTLAAILSTSLGIFFGVTAGYLGGLVDEVTMRSVDILLCLPVLPILLALIQYFKPNVYFIVLLIAIFGWQGLSRVIRSRVLSLREMPFIESAKASGASKSYLIFRHLIPNVFPIAISALILSVPAAVLTEAALSFLGFGDPAAPTWAKMLYNAFNEGAFRQLALWYILPPGFAITFLCVAFVFLGHALDEIVNPRLRRRR